MSRFIWSEFLKRICITGAKLNLGNGSEELLGRIMNDPVKKRWSRGLLSQESATRKTAYSRSDWVVTALVLLLPLVVLYWLVPFAGKYTIGNDYLSYWINNQMYLMFSIKNGTFPLYSPGFLGGWTSSVLTLGQLFHPISWLAAITPGYWNGYAHQIGTILRLAELGVTGAIIFLFLRRLRLAVPLAFVLSFITVYNLRMLDMFRYGVAWKITRRCCCCAPPSAGFTCRRRVAFCLFVLRFAAGFLWWEAIHR